MSETYDNHTSGDVSLPANDENGGGSRWGKAHHVLLIFVAAALVGWILTGFNTVAADEVMIVERLGHFLASEAGQVERRGPGTHWLLPWPIDIPHKVRINQPITLEIKDFFESPPEAEEFKRKAMLEQNVPREVLDSIFDPYLITADKNVLNAKLTIQYQVTDPVVYLMAISHAGRDGQTEATRKKAIAQVATHALIECMARTPVDMALFEGRQQLMRDVAREMNREVGSLTGTAPAATGPAATAAHGMRVNLGISIENVSIEVRWPAQVDGPFKDVAMARQRSQGMVANAEAEGTALRRAAEVGDRSRILAEAAAYRLKVVEDAKGEAARFYEVYDRYRSIPDDAARAKAREITRAALYADAVSTLLDKVSQRIFVRPGEKPTIFLPPPRDRINAAPANKTP